METEQSNQTLPPIDTNKEPKYCRCTSSSVAHLRGCWEGWGDEIETYNSINHKTPSGNNPKE